MNDRLEELKNKLSNVLGLSEELQDGTYLYHLTRVKSAFQIGTLSLDDFVEVDEEFLEEVFEAIKPIFQEQQQENARLRQALENIAYKGFNVEPKRIVVKMQSLARKALEAVHDG